uniref:Methionyl-tRNA formyltransferase n=1 Tax=Candidatus Kentrum sp. SD TaxID=2126332 RepID=A0A451BJS7_9GAMM|nr:MAG: methionyl-tRNA formyltransferase [Candidatus Kentron sp. SD]VFK49762.1 MAG: methionyl-tRNA formyltransferase [Candidatus Kentron sp. SD]VFK78552.1 MAG: methionyl-tRNA formyltransferase [Candidatus Kentron sp. SD]
MMRIVFAGTPGFAAVILESLLATAESPNAQTTRPDTRLPADWRVCGVYTQPDRPVGRGRKLTQSPVKQLARYHCLPIHQPETLRDDATWRVLGELRPDIMVVAAYGLMLPREILEIPRYGCVNVHASLLPRWRGAAPIQRAILAGDQETGVSIMRMEEGLDTGPVLRQAPCPIHADDTAVSLHDRLAALGARTLIRTLRDIEQDRTNPVPQDPDRATYARRIVKSEGEIDWDRAALELERQVRAFIPWPVAYTNFDNQRLRIWESRAVGPRGENAPPGTVTACSPAGIRIAAREGELCLLTVQRPGAKPAPVADFLNGYRRK